MSSGLSILISLENMIMTVAQNFKKVYLLILVVLSSQKVLDHRLQEFIVQKISISKVTHSSPTQFPLPTLMRSWRYLKIMWFKSAVAMPCRRCGPCVTLLEVSGTRSWLKTHLRIRFSNRTMWASPIWLLLTTTQSKFRSGLSSRETKRRSIKASRSSKRDTWIRVFSRSHLVKMERKMMQLRSRPLREAGSLPLRSRLKSWSTHSPKTSQGWRRMEDHRLRLSIIDSQYQMLLHPLERVL